MVDHPGAENKFTDEELVDNLDELVPGEMVGRADYTLDDVVPILKSLDTMLYIVYDGSNITVIQDADEVLTD